MAIHRRPRGPCPYRAHGPNASSVHGPDPRSWIKSKVFTEPRGGVPGAFVDAACGMRHRHVTGRHMGKLGGIGRPTAFSWQSPSLRSPPDRARQDFGGRASSSNRADQTVTCFFRSHPRQLLTRLAARKRSLRSSQSGFGVEGGISPLPRGPIGAKRRGPIATKRSGPIVTKRNCE